MADTSAIMSVRPLLRDLRRATKDQANDSAALGKFATALAARGEWENAVAIFERAVRLDPGDESNRRNWAHTLVALGQIEEAAEVLRETVLHEPMPVALARDLATILLDLDQHDEARELFKLVARRERDFRAVVGLCECCLPEQSWRAAAREASSLVGLVHEEALYAPLGRALIATGRLDDAKECFQEVLARVPNDVMSLIGAGDSASAKQDFGLALQYHTRAQTLNPENADAAFACFMDYLAAGRYHDARLIFLSARRAICSRWGHGSHYSSRAPEWDGSSLSGKTVLVHGAVGFSDTIQHCLFLNLVKEEGGTVVLEVPKPLRSLMQTLSSVEFVVCKFDPLPIISLDFECDLREMFLLREASPNTLGLSVPYVFPCSGPRRRWTQKIAAPGCLRVGIVWEGSRLVRWGALVKCSVPHDKLKPLTEIPNTRLFSLQVGPGSNDLSGRPWANGIVNLESEIHDFLDTAAIVSLLDVVITIDTSVAHLAGAMGKRTFLMLPYSPSWRWQAKREDSPWYPTMRLFRMEEPGNWEGVVTRVKAALTELRSSGRGIGDSGETRRPNPHPLVPRRETDT